MGDIVGVILSLLRDLGFLAFLLHLPWWFYLPVVIFFLFIGYWFNESRQKKKSIILRGLLDTELKDYNLKLNPSINGYQYSTPKGTIHDFDALVKNYYNDKVTEILRIANEVLGERTFIISRHLNFFKKESEFHIRIDDPYINGRFEYCVSHLHADGMATLMVYRKIENYKIKALERINANLDKHKW